MGLSSLGEFGLIRLLARGAPVDGLVSTGIGDDTAVVETGSGPDLLLTCDMLAEGVHFQRRWYAGCPELLGRKALAVNVSDIASMGGEPRYCLVTLGVPPNTDPAFLRRVYDGLYGLAAEYGISVVGGDTVRFDKGLLLDIFLVGEVDRGKALLRSTARPGDLIIVTGGFGLARAGLAVLGQCSSPDQADGGMQSPQHPPRSGQAAQKEAAKGRAAQGQPPAGQPPQLAADDEGLPPPVSAAVSKLLSPEPRLVESRLLRSTGLIRAMSDTSDGLAAQVRLICEASGIGAIVAAPLIPVAQGVQEVAEGCGGNALDWALYGGEDYELIAAVDPADLGTLQKAYAEAGKGSPAQRAPIAVVGWFTAGNEIQLQLDDGRLEPLGQAEWQHFS